MIKKNMFNFMILLSSICLVAVSCNKLFPFNFSDANDVESLRIVDNKTPKVEIDKKIMINPNAKDTTGGDNYGEIVLSVDNGVDFLPLIFTADVVVSANADIRSWPQELALSFDNLNDTKQFYVVSASGLVKKWIIRIVDKTIPPEAEKSNNTTIKSFSFPTFTEGTLTFDATKLNYTTDSIYLPYDKSQTLTSVSFTPTILLATGALFTAGYTTGTPITLNADGTAFPITVMAEDGITTKTYYIALKPFTITAGSGEAEIIDLTIKTVYPSQATITTKMKGFIDAANAIIYIPEYTVYTPANFAAKPIELGVKMTISDKASFPAGYASKLIFTDFNPKNFDIKAENGTIKTWKIQLLLSPQIPNSNFESWSSTTVGGFGTSDSYPLILGGAWSGNNFAPNALVTQRVKVVNPETATPAFSGTTSARISTQFIYVNAVSRNTYTPVSGGSIFLGTFTFKNNATTLADPYSNYTLGVPFTDKPTYMRVAIKYTPGSTPVISANLFATYTYIGNEVPQWDPFVYPDPVDSCDILIRVLDAGGNVIGRNRFATSSTFTNWTELYIPINYTSSAIPATLDIRFTASKKTGKPETTYTKADLYIGSCGLTAANISAYDKTDKNGKTQIGMPTDNTEGSVLYIDDVELIYLPPAITDAYPPLPR